MVRQQRYDAMDSSSSQYGSYSSPHFSKQRAVDRYEIGRPTLQSRSALITSRIIEVFINGANDKKFRILIDKEVTSMDKLLVRIDEKTKKTHDKPVECLYTWPEVRLIRSLGEIYELPKSTIYVCSDKKTKLKLGKDYGKIPYAGSSASGYSRNSGGPSNTLHVISSITGEEINIFMNKRSQHPYPFEGLLDNIRDMFGDRHPRITTLYTMGKPQKKINSLSAINRALEANEGHFWACGDNDEPGYKTSRNVSPKRNGYREKQKSRDQQKQNGYSGDRESHSNGQQSNGHIDNKGRSFQRYQEHDDDDVDHEDVSDQEPSSPPSRRRGRNQDQSPKRDNRKASNQRKRYDDDESPRRESKQAANRRSQRRDDDEDDEEDYRKEKNGRRNDDNRKTKRRDQTPPRKGRNNSNRSDDNSGEEEEDDDEKYNHPSEEEMKERIEEMSQPDDDQDRKIRY